MPVTVPKPRQKFPLEHGDDVDATFHDGLFGFMFDYADRDVSDEAYAAERSNVQFSSSGWSTGAFGGFPLRTVIGDTPHFRLRERTEGRRICCSLPRGSPQRPKTWFSLHLPAHVPNFCPSHYRLRHGKGSAFYAMRSWNLLGSRDGGRWFLIMAHQNEEVLRTGPFATCTFKVWTENVDSKVGVVRCCLPHCKTVIGPLKEAVSQRASSARAKSPASSRKAAFARREMAKLLKNARYPDGFSARDDLTHIRHARCLEHEDICLTFGCTQKRWKPSNYCTVHGGAKERQLVRKGGEAPCAGFRHFKIALTGPNANGGTELYCSGIEFFGSVCDCVRCLAVVESQKSEADKEADMAEVAAKEKQEAVQAELAEKNIKGTAQGLNDHASAEAGGMDGENTKTRDAILDTHDGRPVPNDFVHYDDVEAKLELMPDNMDVATCRQLIYSLQADDLESQAQHQATIVDIERLDVEHLRTKLKVMLRDGSARDRQQKLQQARNRRLRHEAEKNAVEAFGTNYRAMAVPVLKRICRFYEIDDVHTPEKMIAVLEAKLADERAEAEDLNNVEGWTAHEMAHPGDASEKIVYFYHEASGTSQWDRPELKTLPMRIAAHKISNLWLPKEEEEEESQGPTARELEQAAIREKLAEIQRDKLRQGEWGDLFYNLQQRFGALVSEPQIWQCIQQHKGHGGNSSIACKKVYDAEKKKRDAERQKLRNVAKAAFLGLSVDEYEEMLAPPVYMCTIEHVPFRTRPELEAFRTDGTAANEGEFLQQQEAKEVVTDYYTEIIDRRAQEERDRVELEDAEEEVALEQDEVKLSAAANLVVEAERLESLEEQAETKSIIERDTIFSQIESDYGDKFYAIKTGNAFVGGLDRVERENEAKAAAKRRHQENEAKFKAAMREHKKKFKVLAKGVQRAAKECAKIEQAVAAEAQERRQALEDKRSARAERRAELEAEEREDKKARMVAAKDAAFQAAEKAKLEKALAERAAKKLVTSTKGADKAGTRLPPIAAASSSTGSESPTPQRNVGEQKDDTNANERPDTVRLWIKVRDRHWLPVTDAFGNQVLRKLEAGEREKIQRERDENQRVFEAVTRFEKQVDDMDKQVLDLQTAVAAIEAEEVESTKLMDFTGELEMEEDPIRRRTMQQEFEKAKLARLAEREKNKLTLDQVSGRKKRLDVLKLCNHHFNNKLELLRMLHESFTSMEAYLPAFNQLKKDMMENEIPVPLTAREKAALKVMKSSKWPSAKSANQGNGSGPNCELRSSTESDATASHSNGESSHEK